MASILPTFPFQGDTRYYDYLVTTQQEHEIFCLSVNFNLTTRWYDGFFKQKDTLWFKRIFLNVKISTNIFKENVSLCKSYCRLNQSNKLNCCVFNEFNCCVCQIQLCIALPHK